MVAAAHLFARTTEEIRAEARRAQSLEQRALERGEVALACRIQAHVAAYRWLLGEADVAPLTGAGWRR